MSDTPRIALEALSQAQLRTLLANLRETGRDGLADQVVAVMEARRRGLSLPGDPPPIEPGGAEASGQPSEPGGRARGFLKEAALGLVLLAMIASPSGLGRDPRYQDRLAVLIAPAPSAATAPPVGSRPNGAPRQANLPRANNAPHQAWRATVRPPRAAESPLRAITSPPVAGEEAASNDRPQSAPKAPVSLAQADASSPDLPAGILGGGCDARASPSALCDQASRDLLGDGQAGFAGGQRLNPTPRGPSRAEQATLLTARPAPR